MTEHYELAASLAKTDLITNEMKKETKRMIDQGFEQIVNRITAGLPEIFSADHKEELLEKIRERFWLNIFSTAIEYRSANPTYEFGTQDGTIITEAIKRTVNDFEKVDPRNLPAMHGKIDPFSKEKLRLFKILKATCILVSFAFTALMYRSLFSLWDYAGLSGLQEFPAIFMFVASPLGIVLAIGFEYVFRKQFESSELFKRLFGRTNAKGYSGPLIFSITLSPLFAASSYIIAKDLPIEPQTFPTALKIILFLPAVLGTASTFFGLLFGSLLIGFIIYNCLKNVIAHFIFGTYR